MGRTERWSNWSGSVKSMPRQVVKPGNIDQLARLVRDYGRDGRHVRVVGAGHSFTPLVQSDDVLMSLDEMQGIESVDTTASRATVLGGTRLKKLGDTLFEHGMAERDIREAEAAMPEEDRLVLARAPRPGAADDLAELAMERRLG